MGTDPVAAAASRHNDMRKAELDYFVPSASPVSTGTSTKTYGGSPHIKKLLHVLLDFCFAY
jgi:hypothetical protein